MFFLGVSQVAVEPQIVTPHTIYIQSDSVRRLKNGKVGKKHSIRKTRKLKLDLEK